MTPDKATALREAAERATPGEWRSNYEHVWATGYRVGSCDWDLTGTRPSAQCFANAAYIALADPPTILDLLAERERLRGALEEIADIGAGRFGYRPDYIARQALEATDDQPR